MESISIFMVSIAYIASICFLNKLKIFQNKKEVFISIVVLSILLILIEDITLLAVKPFLNFLAIAILQLYLLKNNLTKTLIATVLLFLYSFIFEVLVLISFYLVGFVNTEIDVNSTLNLLNSNELFSILLNLIFSITIIFFSSRKFIKDFYTKIINLKLFKNINALLKIIVLPILTLILSYFVLCYSESKTYMFLIFILLIFWLIYVLLKNIKITNISNETKEKYTNTLKSLTEYEDMIDKYRVSNHENKNQLQMIRTMIHQKDKTVEKYIDNLLDNVYMVNEKLMMDVSMLPSGIKATVYTKMVLMENKRIKYKLNVDRKLRMVDYFDNESSTEIGLKICNILSVFLDNAIEEVENKKDPEIYIEVFYDENDNELTFEISNEIYTKDVDTSKIFEKGYTTKSNGHGYGLALVKEIIDANNNLKNETIIKNNIFTQRLTLKLK